MAAKVVTDLAFKYDNWIKGLNKNFAMVRGPDIFTGDVQKQMKEFNSAIFDIGANIRDGLNSKEVYAFADAFVNTGTAISKITNNMADFRKATLIAAKADANFGMDLQQTSAMMSDMMSNMGLNLNEVDDAFTQVSFDAQKSGLSTDRFWTSVQNATSSLSLYGKFIKSIGRELSVVTKNQTVGAKESIDLVGALNKKLEGGWQETLKVMTFAAKGGFDFKGALEIQNTDLTDSNAKLEDELKSLRSALDSTSNADEAAKLGRKIEDLKIQIGQNEKKIKENTDLMDIASRAKDDPQAMATLATQSAKFTGQSVEMFATAIKGMFKKGGVNQNISTIGPADENYKVLLEIAKSLGLDEEQTKKVLGILGSMKNLSEISLVSGSKNYSDLFKSLDQNSLVYLENILQGINDSADYANKYATLDSKTLSRILGTDEDVAKDIIESAASSEELKNLLLNYVKIAKEGGDTSGLGADIEKLLNTDKYSLDVLKRQYKITGKSAASLKDSYNETFDQIKNSTVPLEKMKDIIGDGVSWQLGSWKSLQSIDTWVTAIGRSYLGSNPDQVSAKEGIDAYIAGKKETEKAKGTKSPWDPVKGFSFPLPGSSGSYAAPEPDTTVDDLVKIIKQQFGSNVSVKDVKTVVPDKYIDQVIDKIFPSYLSEGQNTAPLQAFQGLQDPVKVTHAGAVILHPNESILPASMSNFQSSPNLMTATSGGTANSGGMNNNFQINASDYVMANRLKKAIENTVREILYKDQVNNLG
jgi:hypothetical protein